VIFGDFKNIFNFPAFLETKGNLKQSIHFKKYFLQNEENSQQKKSLCNS